ncbi:STS14 protein-like [Apium graveolens]|uniref:STS14 protein-like n=1 Tax=Apium graveolens TaxID=4045 RepID=UPI003D792299
MARLLATLIIVAFAISLGSSQGSLPSSTTTPTLQLKAIAQEYLDGHNSARAEVGVQPLKWSATVENTADLVVQDQRKKGCEFANSSGGNYGANQYWRSGALVSPREAVLAWVAEKRNYNYANNSCLDNKCGLYTQVVWKKSQELGCAQALCANSSLTICFYNPPGNIVGEKPY